MAPHATERKSTRGARSPNVPTSRRRNSLSLHGLPLSQFLLFLDLETAGLDADATCDIARAVIGSGEVQCTFDRHPRFPLLEIAAVATTLEEPEKPLWEFSTPIKPTSWTFMESLDPVVANMHSVNGLFGACRTHGVSIDEACARLLEKIRALNALDPKAIEIAGNSLNGVDLPYLRKFMPKVLENVSHRTVDVSALYRTLKRAQVPIPPLPEPAEELRGPSLEHRALADAQLSRRQYANMMRALKGHGIELRLGAVARANSAAPPAETTREGVKGLIV